MKKFIYQILMVLAIGAGFTACDSDDDYQPGAPTPANSMQVYFDADNTADYVCGPGEQPEMELKVSRVNAVKLPRCLSFANRQVRDSPSRHR